ncbi:MAG: MFS transporter [Oscillospiraceae bacterium]|jgi:OFA family oxalate/formate antiporter-like MFS transporter|nr:MFS transporter [Oscillospiraceae bacterium]
MDKISQQADRRAIKSLVAGSVLLLFLGIIYVWAKFVAPVSQHLQWDAASVKLTANFMLTCFVIGILLSGMLIGKIKASIIVLIGGLLLAVGVFLASLTPVGAPWLIYIFYGILGGTGVGMAYNTILSCAQQWFPHKRGMAIGISVASFGFSTVIFAPLTAAMCDGLGVVGTFRILAIAFAAVTLALAGLISKPETVAAPAAQANTSAGDDQTLAQALRSPNLYILIAMMIFGNAPYLVSNPSFQTMATERGIGSLGTLMMMIVGVGNALGRFALPAIASKITARNAALIATATTALCSLLLMFAQGIALIPVITLVAFMFGGFSGINPVLTADYFGLKHIGPIYGMVMVGYMIAALSFPIIFKVLDLTDPPKYLVLAILAGVTILLLFLLRKKETASGKAGSV